MHVCIIISTLSPSWTPVPLGGPCISCIPVTIVSLVGPSLRQLVGSEIFGVPWGAARMIREGISSGHVYPHLSHFIAARGQGSHPVPKLESPY